MTSRWLSLIAITALIGGVGSLSIRSGSILSPEGFRPKIFEIALVVAGAAAVLWAVDHVGEVKTFWARRKNILKLIIVMFLGMVAGTLWGLARFGFVPNTGVMIEYGRFITAFATFILMLFWLDLSPRLSRWVVAGFFVPLLYAILLVAPSIAEYFGMILGGGRLQGFHNDPNYFATLLLVPFSFFFVYFLKGKNVRLRSLALVGAILMSALLWWAGSRGSYIAMIIGPFLALFLLRPLRIGRLVILVMMLLAIHFAGFIITPTQGKQATLTKALPSYSETVIKEGVARLPRAIAENPSAIKFGVIENRFTVWPQYVAKAIQHPLGFGPGYGFHSIVTLQGQSMASHNIILETAMVAGWIGLIAAALLAMHIKKSLRSAIREGQNWQKIAVASALVTLVISLFFLESLALRWLWILIALSLAPPRAYNVDKNS